VEASLPSQPTNGQPPLGLVEQGSHQTSKETPSVQQKLNTGILENFREVYVKKMQSDG